MASDRNFLKLSTSRSVLECARSAPLFQAITDPIMKAAASDNLNREESSFYRPELTDNWQLAPDGAKLNKIQPL